ncbi:MAG TPA: FHA domain-containing protein [bacterium]|nr:FHA domain-containing protein [bacterium]
MTEIVVRYEDKVIERVITEKKRISVGRNSDNDIVLDNRGVSRKHAVIEINPNNCVIIDNESLNGTFVNNRRVEEEILNDGDTITIGKYSLVFRPNVEPETKLSDLDGTMTLNTRKHREQVEADRRDREIVARSGGVAVLMGEKNAPTDEIRLAGGTLTFGKAGFCNVKVAGWFVPDIQATLALENGHYVLSSVGHRNKTRVNGEPVDKVALKNGDLLQVGRSVFRFVAGSNV